MADLGGALFFFLALGFFVTNSQDASDSTERFENPLNDTSIFCKDIEPKLLSTGEKNYLVWFHKSLREIVSKREGGKLPRAFFMKKLMWNNTLEDMAKKWAVKCSNKQDLSIDESIGQSIIESIGNSSRVKLKDLFQTLMAGLSQLTPNIIANYKKPKRNDYDYEPLTQILWWNTEHFGCGRSFYKQDCINCTEPKTVVKLVCNYSPKGNKPGEPVYISEMNKYLICKYHPDNGYCTSQTIKAKEESSPKSNAVEEKNKKIAVEFRNRSRTIELWPAIGSQVNVWQTFNITFFYLGLTLAILPHLDNILNMFKLIFCL